ncbi:MAG: efflux RND transporter periplasmic adaptor subunit [Clostridium sp.]|nr:efflux RND transporter periplasmic adaptor subunit [Prevotella sp.]MCM1428608.1 efflux RND transporter periplasmic adaptor subunit [Clostridium sp.]MCM1476185.1 efflux RND transporter periplasmic adaptor subunit [Muribaculaceae bacterium]
MTINKIFCFALVAMMVFGSCSSDKGEGKETKEEKPVVKIENTIEEDVVQEGVYTATVEPEIINNISSSTPNRIKQILVDEGMRVSAGQTLVILDDVNATTYQMQVDNARANLKNVQLNYNRALELFKIGGGTKQSVDQMEAQLVNAKNALASAERTLRNSRENTVLTSPISGVVTARNYDPGDMTGALPVLTVARVQPVKVVINVPESEFSKIKKGMNVDIRFDTYGDATFPGVVSMISPTVDVSSRTFGVEITMPNPDSRVLPGMFGRVTVNLGVSRHVVVPDRAVVKQPGSGNHYVYVYKAGKVSYNKVELGRRLGASYEIISGVPAGSQVVVSGQTKLSDGKEVTIGK